METVQLCSTETANGEFSYIARINVGKCLLIPVKQEIRFGADSQKTAHVS